MRDSTHHHVRMGRGGPITGLEASSAPYSKSHARRLKRREKEQLTGRLDSLKAALPSIAPTTAAAATTIGESSTATTTTTTTATAAGNGLTVKPITKSNKPVAASGQVEAAPPPPRALPGQIGEGVGAPLTRSQRRRALYGPFFFASCRLAFAIEYALFFPL
jgi:hypothetical protein